MLEEMKKEIEKELDEIVDCIDDYKNKQTVLQANTNDSKFMKTIIIGGFSIIPSLMGSFAVIAPLSAGLTFSITVVMSTALAASITIGYVGQSIITSISRRKMKKFTNAKTNLDILKEMIHYEMEIAKLENRRKILNEMYENIRGKQILSNDHTIEFLENAKYEASTLEVLETRKEILKSALDKRTEQLDILTSQSYLKKKFKSYRKKKNRIGNIITGASYISMLFSFLIGMPLSLELIKDINLESFVDLGKYIAIMFSPTLIAAPLSIPFFNKRNKDIMSVYNNLNQSLGENALSKEPNVEYEGKLNYMISSKMREIIELSRELKEVSYALKRKSLETTAESKDKAKEKPWDDVLYTEEEIHQYMQMPETSPALFNFGDSIFEQYASAILNSGVEAQNSASQQEENSSGLVRKRTRHPKTRKKDEL